MKVVIVGGVAGGASAVARIRRLDEHAQIVMIERSGLYILCQLRPAVLCGRCDQGAGRIDAANSGELLGSLSH